MCIRDRNVCGRRSGPRAFGGGSKKETAGKCAGAAVKRFPTGVDWCIVAWQKHAVAGHISGHGETTSEGVGLNCGWFQDKNRRSWHRNRPSEANHHQKRGLAQQLLNGGNAKLRLVSEIKQLYKKAHGFVTAIPQARLEKKTRPNHCR